MPSRLTFSLTLNALGLGLVLWLVLPGSRSEARARVSHLLANRVSRLKHQPAPPPVEATAPEVIEVIEPFNWAQVESADYRVYLANLRGIGCPESTVRDILIADVNDLFNGRVKTLVDGVSGQFWNLITHEAEFEKLVDEKEKQLRALDEERDELFTLLFGDSNPRAEEEARASATVNQERWERLADFLPPVKRAQWVAAKDELERTWKAFLRTPGQTGAQQQAKRKELEAAHEQALRQWLTPDEYAELRLRQSPAANLPEGLVGLDLTEDQVRAAAKIELATADAQAALSQKDADFKSRTALLQQQSEAQTQELIGPEAYAALQRATDNRYEPFYRVTQRLELPDAAAAQAYDIRRKAQDAARQLLDNESLSVEDRQAMLQAISAEAKQGLSTALGPKGFAAYDKLDGGWMNQLTSHAQ
jgi:hypothetical protein